MAYACLHVMALQIRPEPGAKLVRCHRLTDGANIVALALHREEHSLAYSIRVDALAAPLQLTARERMVLKDKLHGFEVEFRGKIEHSEIFVVERLCHRGF